MEVTLRLNRNKATDKAKQTVGVMVLFENLTSIFKCFTLELPWLNNSPKISCIPAGEYECEKRAATAAIPYEHIFIKDVEGRAGICIHKANYYLQLKGCIAIGDKHVDLNNDGEFDVRNSGVTLTKLMSLLPKTFKIIIADEN